MSRYCHTCGQKVDDANVMFGKYWDGTPPCAREGCDARFNILKERDAYQSARAAAGDFDGPGAVPCIVCGAEIGSYESRQFGKSGAVHIHPTYANPPGRRCWTEIDDALFPFSYSDG